MDDWWHFLCWKCLNKKIFKDTITQQDLVGKLFYLDIIYVVKKDDDVEEKGVYEKCYKFEKNGEIYILAEKEINNLPINPTLITECYLKPSDKTICKLIIEYDSAKVLPEKTMSIRDLIKNFNPVQHTNEKTRIFLNVVMLASKYKPIKIQLCGATNSGKTMNYNILKYMTNDVVRIQKPTLAKLETLLFFNKVVLPDEMTSLESSEIRKVEPTFLAIADETPELEKHSLATSSIMNRIALDETSIIFTYNRIKDLNPDKKFFLQVWQNPSAIRSRYPALLIDGVVLDKIKKMGTKEAEEIMNKYGNEMVNWMKNILYYINFLCEELHFYDRHVLFNFLRGRQYPNFEGIIDVFDAYCETQEEFNEWQKQIINYMKDYNEMIKVLEEEKSFNGLKNFFVEVEEVK